MNNASTSGAMKSIRFTVTYNKVSKLDNDGLGGSEV